MTGLAAEGAEVAGVPLEIVALAGAAVVLVGVAAVRVSSRLGLPSLLLYLGIGVAIGEAGLGLRFDDAALSQTLGLAALVVILTEGGLTTRWQRGPAGACRWPSCCPRSGWRSASRSPPPPPWCCWTPTGGPACCSARSSRPPTPPRCSPPCARSALPARLTATLEMESGFNDAPGGHPGHAAVQRRERLAGRGRRRWSLYELVAGAAIGLAIGLRRRPGCCAAGALPAAGLYPLSDARRRRRLVRAGDGRARVRLPGRVPDRAGARATCRCRTGTPPSASSRGWPGSPRSGCSCCSGCWSARAGWRRRCCRRSGSGRRCCCWPGRCRCSRPASGSGCAWAEQVFVVLGRAARRGADRAGHDPADRRRAGGAPASSTSSSCWWWSSRWCRAPRWPRWPGCSGSPRRRRAARRRGRLGAAGGPGRRPAAGAGSRPRRGCTACWCRELRLPAGAGARRCWSADGAGFVPGPDTRLQPRRPAAGRHHRAGPGRGRAAAAGGQPGRPAGRLAGRQLRRVRDPARWDTVAAQSVSS